MPNELFMNMLRTQYIIQTHKGIIAAVIAKLQNRSKGGGGGWGMKGRPLNLNCD